MLNTISDTMPEGNVRTFADELDVGLFPWIRVVQGADVSERLEIQEPTVG